jgi:uncharacterized protein YukE
MSDVSRLKERLVELRLKLESFDDGLEEDFRALTASWERLDSAWDGVAYQEFVQSWKQAQSMFKQYVSLSQKYEDFLRERIEALQRFEQSGGV